ncbi:MAG TPA: tetratricopeptide repeat protein [Thermoanaerobaculia bacterium]|nr:tetratricopeptide repeat protein [Thermoanaerobaculia bacterium]
MTMTASSETPGRAHRALRSLGVLLAAGCLLCGGACRSTSLNVTEDLELQQGLRARGLDPASVTVPWRLSAEMRLWVHHAVPDNLGNEERLQRLLSALLGSDGLALVYKAGTTATAQEVFASHQANCLAFTSIFVGMAREVGVPVFYLDVGDIEKFERDGNLVVESGHITAGYGSGTQLRILEFTPIATPSYRQIHRISDQTAVALYYSNRGAELLRGGSDGEALGWLQKAVALDPELARGWINYGVALRRTGNAAGAEAAYRKALEDDPSSVAAYQNLAALLFVGGRAREAGELMALSGKLDSRNPFNYLALGDVSLGQGRIDEARHFYRKAQHLEGAAADADAALGQLALATGDRREARRWLHKAVSRDSANDRVQRLAAQLGEKIPRPAPVAHQQSGPRERQQPAKPESGPGTPGIPGTTARATAAPEAAVPQRAAPSDADRRAVKELSPLADPLRPAGASTPAAERANPPAAAPPAPAAPAAPATPAAPTAPPAVLAPDPRPPVPPPSGAAA